MRLTRPRFTVRRPIVLAVVVVVVPLACLRAYRHVIPAGAGFFPFWIASDEGPRLDSPDRSRNIQVVFNDAGAAHSGNHWTWLVVDDWLMGKRVIAEGYSLPEVRYGKVSFPLRWIDDRTFSVEFTEKRYESTSRKPVAVGLP